MPVPTQELARQIHAQPWQMVLAITGGGTAAIGELLSVPGGSHTVLEAVVPYSSIAIEDWLGGRVETYCSPRTARAMAMAAFQRARRLAQPIRSDAAPDHLTGIACTASLASDRPKRGSHRAHVASQTLAATTTYSLELIKGARSRHEEEVLVTRLILDAIGEAFGVGNRPQLETLPHEKIEIARTVATPSWQELMLGRIGYLLHDPSPRNSKTPARAVMPGSFDPLHLAHEQMAHIASELLGQPVDFELSIANVDKPPLDYTEIERRLDQFPKTARVYLTRAATFDQKSELMLGATFIVGADTILRIANSKYYDGNSSAMDETISRIGGRGCRFLVFGRMLDGSFRSLKDLDLPLSLRRLCDEVPADRFREDISSTQLRKQNYS